MTPAPPPPTDQHLAQALDVLGWQGWDLRSALAHPTRSRVVRALATTIAAREWRARMDREWAWVHRDKPAESMQIAAKTYRKDHKK